MFFAANRLPFDRKWCFIADSLVAAGFSGDFGCEFQIRFEPVAVIIDGLQ